MASFKYMEWEHFGLAFVFSLFIFSFAPAHWNFWPNDSTEQVVWFFRLTVIGARSMCSLINVSVT